MAWIQKDFALLVKQDWWIRILHFCELLVGLSKQILWLVDIVSSTVHNLSQFRPKSTKQKILHVINWRCSPNKSVNFVDSILKILVVVFIFFFRTEILNISKLVFCKFPFLYQRFSYVYKIALPLHIYLPLFIWTNWRWIR